MTCSSRDEGKMIEETQALAKEFEQQYNDGLITLGEKYTRSSTPGGEVHRQDRRRDDGRIKAVQFNEDTGRQKPRTRST